MKYSLRQCLHVIPDVGMFPVNAVVLHPVTVRADHLIFRLHKLSHLKPQYPDEFRKGNWNYMVFGELRDITFAYWTDHMELFFYKGEYVFVTQLFCVSTSWDPVQRLAYLNAR